MGDTAGTPAPQCCPGSLQRGPHPSLVSTRTALPCATFRQTHPACSPAAQPGPPPPLRAADAECRGALRPRATRPVHCRRTWLGRCWPRSPPPAPEGAPHAPLLPEARIPNRRHTAVSATQTVCPKRSASWRPRGPRVWWSPSTGQGPAAGHVAAALGSRGVHALPTASVSLGPSDTRRQGHTLPRGRHPVRPAGHSLIPPARLRPCAQGHPAELGSIRRVLPMQCPLGRGQLSAVMAATASQSAGH